VALNLDQIKTIQAHAKRREPCDAGEHSERIIRPEVHPDEADPNARADKMEQVANETGDAGDHFEVAAARHNIADGSITHGNQLSRKRTESEAEDGVNGDEQKIWAVCTICGAKRELDQTPTGGVAEAKDRARNSGQHDQFANNAKLQKDGLHITYKVPDAQARGGRGKAIRDAFRSCGGRAPSIPFGIM
jgi:hypothetical protein